MKCFLSSAAIALSLVACGVSEPETKRADRERNQNPIVAEQDFQLQVRANTDFGLELLRNIDSEKPNAIFSPYSMTSAMAMLYAGARGDTATELADVLHFELANETLHPMMNKLGLALTARVGEVDDEDLFELQVRNDLWVQKSFEVVPEYLEVLAENYGTGVRVLPFDSDPAGSREIINTWIQDQTHGRIKDLMPADSIGPSTRLVLTNSIYFKADWLFGFEKDATLPGNFVNAGGATVSTSMMHQTEDLAYGEGDGYQAIELPYQGDQVALLVVMPSAGTTAQMLAALDAEKLAEITSGLAVETVSLSFPKWTFDQEIDLKKVFTAMGMKAPFDAADFSGLNATEGLVLDTVVHKAFILVDEEGTEAAAATGGSIAVSARRSREVSIDHPFFYFLRDKVTGAVLFMGRVNELSGSRN